MTATILQFKRPEPKKVAKQPPSNKPKSNQDIFKGVFNEIIAQWQKAAAVNGLSDFLVSKLPAGIRKKLKTTINIIDDLNALAFIESGLNMKVALYYPGATATNSVGWTATFHRGKEVFSTPPDMASEAAARALNIILHVSLESTLKS